MLRRWLTLLVVTVALLVRLWRDKGASLWSDEVFSATLAMQSPLEALVSGVRFDLHPPLYYFQLSLWALLGSSDDWLYLNSILFSTLTVLVVQRASARVFGAATGLVAGLALALSPPELYLGQTLRMYSLLGLLAVCAWSLVQRVATESTSGARRESRRASALLVAIELALVYSHGLGFYTVFFIGLYGLAVALGSSSGTERTERMRRVLLLHIGVALLALPVIGNSLVRDAAHLVLPDLERVLSDWGFLSLGTAAVLPGIGRVSALVLLAGLGATAVAVRAARPIVIWLVLAPMLMLLALSFGFVAMWYRRTLAFVQPFVVIGLAAGAVALGQRMWAERSALRHAPAAALVVLLGTFAWLHRTRYEKPQDFRACVAALRAELPDGGVILVPELVDFWAVNRYFVGPRWGSPLELQPTPMSDQWRRVLDRLGPRLSGALGLIPEGDRLEAGPYTIAVGPEFAPGLLERSPAVIVHSAYLALDVSATWPGFERMDVPSARGIELYRRGHAGE